jgi:hypothetical protein
VIRRAVCAAAAAVCLMVQPVRAQPPTGRGGAPIDLTGTWVSIVNEDWRWRMMTPPKGDYASVPLNDAGRAEADKWTPALDGRCEAYGVGGLMRMPTRLRISWQDDTTLKIEADAGVQTRLLHFGPAAGSGPAAGPRTLQGYTAASWEYPGTAGGGRGGGRGRGGPPPATPKFGTLHAVTTSHTAGWLRRNGVPYSDGAAIVENFDRFKSPNGDEWFVVTTAVNDPKYLAQEFVTSSHFKREADGSKWSPMPCTK